MHTKKISHGLRRFMVLFSSILMIISLMASAFWGFGVISVSAEATYAPTLLGALAERLNWIYQDEGGLAGKYAEGVKVLGYIGGPIRFVGDVQVYVDLQDYYSSMYKDQYITEEGRNDWITVWLDANVGLSWSLMPFGSGLSEVPMVAGEKDPGRQWGLSGPSACAGILKTETMEWTPEGFDWGQGASFRCVDLGASIVSFSKNVLRFEMQRSVLDELVETALLAAGAAVGMTIDPTISVAFGYELVTRLVEFEGYKPHLNLPDPSSWRHFTSTDDNGDRPLVDAKIDSAWGGLDTNGDGIPDNIFPYSSAGPEASLTYFNLDVMGKTLGNNAANYSVSVSDLPSSSGWTIYALDGIGSGLSQSPYEDRTYNLHDVPPVDPDDPDSNTWQTHWRVGCTEAATESITIEFQLKHSRPLLIDPILDTVSITLSKGPAFTGDAPRITHTPVMESTAGDSILVEAMITDNTGVEEAWLWYLPRGSEDYTGVPMNPVGGDLYQSTIPAEATTQFYLLYYIAASNGQASTLSPSIDLYSVLLNQPNAPISLSNSSLDPPSGSSSLIENWTFGVKYTSPSNTSPEYVRLRLSGSSYPEAVFNMSRVNPDDNNYADGTVYRVVHPSFNTGTYSYSFEASDGDSQAVGGPFTLQVTTPQAAEMSVVPDPHSIPLDGFTRSLVTATVLTDHGTPLQNTQVTFGCTGVMCSFFQVDTGEMYHRVDTDENGQAQIYLKPRSSGTGTVTATLDNNVSVSEDLEVTGSNDVDLRIRFLRESDLVYLMHIDAVYLANGDPIQFEDVTISTDHGTLTAVGNPSISGSTVVIKTNSSDGGSYVGAVEAWLTIPSEGETSITATVRSVSESVTTYLGGEPAWIRPFLHLPEDRAADWSADGSKIAIGGSDYLVHVYDTTTWNQLIQWQPEDGFANVVYDLSFAPDRDEIAIASRYATRERVSDGVKIWEGSLLSTRYVDWSPDGSWIAGGSKSQTVVYTISGSIAHTFTHTDDWIRSLAFSPDGEYLLMGHDSGRVRIVRTSNWSTLIDYYSDTDADGNDEVWAAAWSPDSSKYVISTAELGLLLFNRSSSSPYASYTNHGIPSDVDALAWCPISDTNNPGYGKIASSAGDSLHIWNADTQQPLLQAPNSGANYALAWSPDCELLVFPAGVVAPWDTVGPNIEITSHYNGQVVQDNPTKLEGTIQDPFFVDAATVSLNGGPAVNLSLDGDGNFSQGITLIAGDNTIVVNAEDGTGNPSSSELTITLLADQSGPQISLPEGASPGPLAYPVCELTTISASVSDPWVGLDPTTVTAVIQHPDGVDITSFTLFDDGTQGGDSNEGDGIFTGQWDSCSAVEGGYYYVDVSASDTEGNQTTADNLITLDYYDLPIIAQVSHSPTDPTNEQSVMVSLQATDTSGISQAVVQYSSDDGITYTPVNMIYNDGTGEYEGSIPPQDMGEIQYRIEVQDAGGYQTNSELFYYGVSDVSSPSFEAWGQNTPDLLVNWLSTFQVEVLVSDEGGSGLDGMTPQLRYKRGEYDADYSAYFDMSLGVGGGAGLGMPLEGGGTWVFDIPVPVGGWGMIEGELVSWEVQLSDAAGNLATSSVRVEFVDDDDSFGPVIGLSSYMRYILIGDQLVVKAMINDSTSGDHGVSEARLYYGYEFPYKDSSVVGVGPGGNGDGEWTFTIPTQDASHLGEIFRFYIVAQDGDDSPATSYAIASAECYPVTVIEDWKIYLPFVVKGY